VHRIEGTGIIKGEAQPLEPNDFESFGLIMGNDLAD
jgi:hypothetical protein